MLFQILPIFWIIAICAKIPMTKKLIMKFPIISKIWLMLLKFIKDLDINGMYSSPNNLTGFNTGGIMSSTQTTSIMDTPWNHNIAYSYLPGNVYYNSSLENN